jgi:hypothetical protein
MVNINLTSRVKIWLKLTLHLGLRYGWCLMPLSTIFQLYHGSVANWNKFLFNKNWMVNYLDKNQKKCFDNEMPWQNYCFKMMLYKMKTFNNYCNSTGIVLSLSDLLLFFLSEKEIYMYYLIDFSFYVNHILTLDVRLILTTLLWSVLSTVAKLKLDVCWIL